MPYGSQICFYGCLTRELVAFYAIRVFMFSIRAFVLFAYGFMLYGCLQLPYGSFRKLPYPTVRTV